MLTRSSATVTLADNSFDFNGAQLEGSVNDASSGGSYKSTSSLDGDEITFKNGNWSAGDFASVSSFTSLDITFTNDSGAAVLPKIHSTLLPAGIGLLVSSGCGDGPVHLCSQAPGSPIGFSGLPRNFEADTNLIAGSMFLFRILSDEAEVFTLTGRVLLRYDPQLQMNVLSADVSNAASVLTGFTQVSNNDTGFGFAWDATDIEIDLGGVMNVGDSRTLTYETGVTTFTRSPLAGCAGAIAFGAFGDPIGRGGSIPPPPVARVGALSHDGRCAIAGQRPKPPEARSFRFAVPTFVNGTLEVALLPPFGGSVPEPASWALMLGGFGLAGTALRRRRAAAPQRPVDSVT